MEGVIEQSPNKQIPGERSPQERIPGERSPQKGIPGEWKSCEQSS